MQWLGGVTDVLRKGLRLGLKRLKTRHDFRFSPITDGLTAEQVIQKLPEARRRVLLKAMFLLTVLAFGA